jgi:hypothetical protein
MPDNVKRDGQQHNADHEDGDDQPERKFLSHFALQSDIKGPHSHSDDARRDVDARGMPRTPSIEEAMGCDLRGAISELVDPFDGYISLVKSDDVGNVTVGDSKHLPSHGVATVIARTECAAHDESHEHVVTSHYDLADVGRGTRVLASLVPLKYLALISTRR